MLQKNVINGNMNFTSYPENCITYVNMSQLRNELSFISRFAIYSKIQRKTLLHVLLPNVNHLRILTQLTRYILDVVKLFMHNFIFYSRGNCEIKVRCLLFIHCYHSSFQTNIKFSNNFRTVANYRILSCLVAKGGGTKL